MERTIPVSEGAEAFLELLNANGVDYLFLNPGTDTFSVQGAVSKYKALGKPTPEVILCLHESVAMAAAHGYFMVSGKPQVVLVHADLGPQQVGGALHNAQRGRAGVILCSGRVPSDIDSGRLNPVHWLQEQFDQAGVVRGYVKWEYELRTAESIPQVLQRAFQIASSEPCGPVYLSLPQDVMAADMTSIRVPDVARHTTSLSCGADSDLLSKVASLLIEAKNPLIITSYSGRHTESVNSLVALAEELGAPVFDSPYRVNFPTNHPLYGGLDPNPYLAKADVILIIDNDIPYVPSQAKPNPEAKIIHIDIDPLKENLPMWGFPVDILIKADSSHVLPTLNQMVRERLTPEQQSRCQARSRLAQAENQQKKEKYQTLASTKSTQKPISPDWLFHCLDEVIEDDTILLGETVTNRAAMLRQVHRSKPGTFFQSGGSNLGWGLGAAIGAKLAAPDKTVVSLVGDGSFIFGCPTAALWMASIHQAPFLCIILNNMRYNAPSLALGRKSKGESYPEMVGININPCPDYAAIARACHAYGNTVSDPVDLKSALKSALDEVRSGKPAVLDVRIGFS